MGALSVLIKDLPVEIIQILGHIKPLGQRLGALQLLERQERAIHQLELVIQNISVEFRVVGKASSAVLQYHVDIDGVLLGESALAAQILVAE